MGAQDHLVTRQSSGGFLATPYLRPCSCGVTSVWISLRGAPGVGLCLGLAAAQVDV